MTTNVGIPSLPHAYGGRKTMHALEIDATVTPLALQDPTVSPKSAVRLLQPPNVVRGTLVLQPHNAKVVSASKGTVPVAAAVRRVITIGALAINAN